MQAELAGMQCNQVLTKQVIVLMGAPCTPQIKQQSIMVDIAFDEWLHCTQGYDRQSLS